MHWSTTSRRTCGGYPAWELKSWRCRENPAPPHFLTSIAVVIAPVVITIVVVVRIMIMIVVIVIGSPRKPLCEVGVLFHQQLRRTFRPDEDRVGVEPDVRVGLHVEGHLLDPVEGRQMRRTSGVRAAYQRVVDIEDRAAGAVGDIRRCDRNVGTAGADIARCCARGEDGREG